MLCDSIFIVHCPVDGIIWMISCLDDLCCAPGSCQDLFSYTDRRTIHYPACYTVNSQSDKDIPPKYPYLMLLLPFRDRTLKFQVLCSNLLPADFKLQWISVMLSELTTCKIIWKLFIGSTKAVADGSFFFRAVSKKKYGTFCNILRSRIIILIITCYQFIIDPKTNSAKSCKCLFCYVIRLLSQYYSANNKKHTFIATDLYLFSRKLFHADNINSIMSLGFTVHNTISPLTCSII